MAAKLRVVATIAPDCHDKALELKVLCLLHPRRPFPKWSDRAYFAVLDRCVGVLGRSGITAQSVEEKRSHDTAKKSFQWHAEAMITARLDKPYSPIVRIRQKLVMWKLRGIPAHLEARILRNLKLLQSWCAPRVLAIYFKTIWNGWVTDDRMKMLLAKQGRPVRACVLGCGCGEVDRVEHYARCSVFWRFLSRCRPSGLGVPFAWRSAETFLMVSDLLDEDKIRLSLGMYALHMTVQHCRHNFTDPATIDLMAMLRLFSLQAAKGSKARQLLRY